MTRYDDRSAFLAAAGSFLAAREAEHNLILGIAGAPPSLPEEEVPPLLATVTGDEGAVVAAAIQTPPPNLILSEADDHSAPTRLADALRDANLPGAVGPPDVVRAFAERWTAATGAGWEVRREERIYRLREVAMPASLAGEPRLATGDDRDQIRGWILEFRSEVMDEAEAGLIERALDAWERGNGRRFWFWEVAGRPVSMVGAGGRTPNGMRIGPVYTPPADRRRGYASQLTAWVSQAMLDEGRRYCFLYTDLGNPTSNHIYQVIGYEPVTDAVMVSFTP